MSQNRPKILVLCVDSTAMRALSAAAGGTCDLVWLRDSIGLLRLGSEIQGPGAAVVDITMPNVNAVEALQALKNAFPNLRRILLSDYCDLALIVQGLHTGAVQNIVYKPVHSNELMAALGSVVSPPAHVAAAPPVAFRASA